VNRTDKWIIAGAVFAVLCGIAGACIVLAVAVCYGETADYLEEIGPPPG
jgi:hypothetical protein